MFSVVHVAAASLRLASEGYTSVTHVLKLGKFPILLVTHTHNGATANMLASRRNFRQISFLSLRIVENFVGWEMSQNEQYPFGR